MPVGSPRPSPLILSLETATAPCSVALHAGATLLAAHHLFTERSASERLAPMVEGMLWRCGLAASRLDAVAVSAGPGSYTGLRVGAAMAKGLSYTLSVPLVAVNTLEAMARQARAWADRDALLCPMIDARRMEVFCMLVDRRGRVVSPAEAVVVTRCRFAPWLRDHKILFFGDGAGKCADELADDNAVFEDGIVPSAVHVGQLALDKLRRRDVEDPFLFEPNYIKAFTSPPPKDNSLRQGPVR